MLQIEDLDDSETKKGCWHTPCCCGRSKGACWLINCLLFWIISGTAVGLGVGLTYPSYMYRYYYSYSGSSYSNSYNYYSPSTYSYYSPSTYSYYSPSTYSYTSPSTYISTYVSNYQAVPSTNTYSSSSGSTGFISINGETTPCDGDIVGNGNVFSCVSNLRSKIPF